MTFDTYIYYNDVKQGFEVTSRNIKKIRLIILLINFIVLNHKWNYKYDNHFFSQHKNLYLHFSRENKNDFCLFKNKTFCFKIKKKRYYFHFWFSRRESSHNLFIFFVNNDCLWIVLKVMFPYFIIYCIESIHLNTQTQLLYHD